MQESFTIPSDLLVQLQKVVKQCDVRFDYVAIMGDSVRVTISSDSVLKMNTFNREWKRYSHNIVEKTRPLRLTRRIAKFFRGLIGY